MVNVPENRVQQVIVWAGVVSILLAWAAIVVLLLVWLWRLVLGAH